MKRESSFTDDVEEFNAAARQLLEALGFYRLLYWLSDKLNKR
jgi:hypothetical protein